MHGGERERGTGVSNRDNVTRSPQNRYTGLYPPPPRSFPAFPIRERVASSFCIGATDRLDIITDSSQGRRIFGDWPFSRASMIVNEPFPNLRSCPTRLSSSDFQVEKSIEDRDREHWKVYFSSKSFLSICVFLLYLHRILNASNHNNSSPSS